MVEYLHEIVIFAVGLALLLGSAELLVRSASKLAILIGKSSLFIGLTVTAFGTSAPELAVGISGQLSHNGAVGLGNIVGSNIFNIFFVLGLAAVFRPIVIHRPVIWRDIPILLVACSVFFVLALNGVIGVLESLLLVAILAAYLYYLSRNSHDRPDVTAKVSPESEPSGLRGRLPLALVLIAVSIAVMIIGARLVVAGATGIAGGLGMSELVTGLTIVAVGTSLPEIATTVAAVRNNKHELAVGNVIGSTFFNIIAVPAAMSLTGSAGLLVTDEALSVDIPVMILAVVACLPIFFSGHRISRSEGVLFLAYYAAYSLFLYTRNASNSMLHRYQTELGLFALTVIMVTLVAVLVRALRYRQRLGEEIGP